jgi:two-component system LytT family response regulator/two-component system response regulator LytT
MDIKALVVDDEQLAREELCYLLEQAGGVTVMAQAANGVDALALIEAHEPDLVFLDVQMPGLNGFEVARRVLERPDAATAAEIVFVTAFDQYAIDAFQVDAVDYLLKPVDPERLEQAVQRARRRLAARGAPRPEDEAAVDRPLANAELERLVKRIAQGQGRPERLAVKVGERFLLVDAAEVIFATLADEVVTVAATGFTGTSNYRTLDDLQAQLDPGTFWRVHRAYLVNINKIKEIVPWFSRNYILKMSDGKSTEIPVSRSQTKRLREYLRL